MLSCSHFNNFLSDPIGKQSRYVKERARSERLPLKVHRWRNQKQWFQRRRDQSTWCYEARGARGENLPQDLGGTVDPRNVDEGQGIQTSTRKLVRITQSPGVERSQVRRQENAQHSDS